VALVESQFDRGERIPGLVVDSPTLSSTMMVNRALVELALPMKGAAYQDWWSMLVAAAFGIVVMLDERTILLPEALCERYFCTLQRHAQRHSASPLRRTW
jgi:hypothetical protein